MKKNIVINPNKLNQKSKDSLTIHALFEASSHYNTHIGNTSMFISIIALLLGLLSLIISLNNDSSWLIIIVGYGIVFSIILFYLRFSIVQKEVEKKLNRAKENHTKMFKATYDSLEK